jgi:hypothetical protein
VPAILLAFMPAASATAAVEAYAAREFWLWLAVMVVSQIAFLAVPVRFASRRPVTRRSVWPTLLAGGLMAGGLAMGAVFSILEFILRDQSEINWITTPGIGLMVLTWCVWGIIFFRLSRNVSAEDLVSRQCRWLLKGSILELLIAVPTHIVARCRDYCCAGFMTFIGLTMGISVMLFSFGPAVFFLFAERWKRLHPERAGGVERSDRV